MFKGTSKRIQNELLQIVLETCHAEIVKQIYEADFLSVIADETSDVSNQYQMSSLDTLLKENQQKDSGTLFHQKSMTLKYLLIVF